MSTPIDLSQIPTPDLIEVVSYEQILAEMIADFIARVPTYSSIVESDPLYKIFEVASYREFLLRLRVNKAAISVMLAYAQGTDLDNLGALNNIARLDTETDEQFRKRIQLAPEGYSVAGPEGAYIFHGLSSDANVKDIKPSSPTPGVVNIAVLSKTGDGTADTELCDTVYKKLSDKTIRPLTDQVNVLSAEIVSYTIEATIYFNDGPDKNIILANCQKSIEAYKEKAHKIGQDINISAIHAALHQEGVQKVTLISPTENIVINDTEAGYCTNIILTDGGVYE